MIRQHETLFPVREDTPPPSARKAENPKKSPRSFVGWECAEVQATTTREGRAQTVEAELGSDSWTFKPLEGAAH